MTTVRERAGVAWLASVLLAGAAQATGIAGRITRSADASVVQGAQVTAISSATFQIAGSAFSDDNGDYHVDLAAGGYYLVAGASGLSGEIYDNRPCPAVDNCDIAAAVVLTLDDAQELTGKDFALDAVAGIRGTVRGADTNDGVAAVEVLLYDGADQLVASVSTQGDGRYEFSGIEGGPYFAVTRAPSGYLDQLYSGIACPLGACTPSSGTPLSPTAQAPASGVDFLLPRGGAISGRLREVGYDFPVVGATVEVYDAQARLLAQTGSSAAGQFLTPALPDGNYTLRAVGANYQSQLYPDVPCPEGACDPTAGAVIAVTAPQTTALPTDWPLPRNAATPLLPPTVYLNRCVGGCVVRRGADSAINNTSSIIGLNTANIAAFPYGDAAFDALAQCVRKVFAPYFIGVVTSDPGNVPHRELMIGGLPAAVGMDSGRLGVSPWACGSPLQNAIAFSFAAAMPDDVAEQCHTATHEIGHLFGLDHDLWPEDTMSYAGIVDQLLHFTDVDAGCFDNSGTPVPCYCGTAAQQNTHRKLADRFGLERFFGDGFGDNPYALPPPSSALRAPALRTDGGLACGTRTDRYTPVPAAWWVGGPPQVQKPDAR